MHYFVTGATGFICKRLVKKLLERKGAVVHFLMRKESADKVTDLRAYWGVGPARAIPVFGDLKNKKLGVGSEDIRKLKVGLVGGQVDGLLMTVLAGDRSAARRDEDDLGAGLVHRLPRGGELRVFEPVGREECDPCAVQCGVVRWCAHALDATSARPGAPGAGRDAAHTL